MFFKIIFSAAKTGMILLDMVKGLIVAEGNFKQIIDKEIWNYY